LFLKFSKYSFYSAYVDYERTATNHRNRKNLFSRLILKLEYFPVLKRDLADINYDFGQL
jgi:hypothetical protein